MRASAQLTIAVICSVGCASTGCRPNAPAERTPPPVAVQGPATPAPPPPPEETRSDVQPIEVSPDTITIAPSPTTLEVGEKLVYQGRWMGIPVGWGSVEVHEVMDMEGRRVFHLIGEAHSNDWLSKFYPVHDVVHSYVDVEALRPVRYEKSQREGHYRAEETVIFDHATGMATYNTYIDRELKEMIGDATKHVPITPATQDLLSAFFLLRLQPVTIGGSLYLDIYSDEKVFHTETKVLKTMVLEIRRRGVFHAIQVEPLATFKGLLVDRGRVHFYFTTDSRRVPLYIQLWTPWGLVTGTIDRATAERIAPAARPARAGNRGVLH